MGGFIAVASGVLRLSREKIAAWPTWVPAPPFPREAGQWAEEKIPSSA